MPDSAPNDRLQPFLLQRLKDEQPDVRQESRERRIISPAEYRRTLLEDLAALLNSGNHLPPEQLKKYPEAARSVINYGVTELAGSTVSGTTGEMVAKMVQNAIVMFEPRVLKQTLEVRAVDVLDAAGSHVVELEIRGEIWNVPAPESLYVRTAVDLETGRVELRTPTFGG
jgi:type VI secretion system protein ImpF